MISTSPMLAALQLAWKGRFASGPNPLVGAVITQGEATLASGWHRGAGYFHAERACLADFYRLWGARSRDLLPQCTMWVSLEPCNHQGRQPPCTQAILDSGLQRVVYLSEDPNPQVAGTGGRFLREQGVQAGPLPSQIAGVNQQSIDQLGWLGRWINRGYFKRHLKQAPWVTLKSASSLDGKTALADGRSYWITSGASRQLVQQERASVDAIVTGISTIAIDRPRYTLRLDEMPVSLRQSIQQGEVDLAPKPLVVLDSKLASVDLPHLHARIKLGQRQQKSGDTVWAGPVWIIYTGSADPQRLRRLAEMGAELIECGLGEQVDLKQLLAILYDRQCKRVLIESGPTLLGACIQADIADELVMHQGPVLLGEEARPMAKVASPAEVPQAVRWQVPNVPDEFLDLTLPEERRSNPPEAADFRTRLVYPDSWEAIGKVV